MCAMRHALPCLLPGPRNASETIVSFFSLVIFERRGRGSRTKHQRFSRLVSITFIISLT